MKIRLLTIAAVLFVLALAVPAHAQTGTMCCFGAVGNNPFDYSLAPAQTQPQFGFTVYSTPAWPFFLYLNLSKTWAWTSTCPQGGIAFGSTTTLPDQAGNPTTINQVNVNTSIANPFTGWIQGHMEGLAVVLTVGQPPSWLTVKNMGGPCDKPGRMDQVQTDNVQ